MPSASLGRIILYSKRLDEMVAFYALHFGYSAHRAEGDRIVELRPDGPGIPILLHGAGKAQREGQVQAKLVFDVADVDGFVAEAMRNGLAFGPIHRVDGYAFANARDPSQNAIQVSSRAFAVK